MSSSRLPAPTDERLWSANKALLNREARARLTRSPRQILIDRAVSTAAVSAIAFAAFAIARVFNIV
jgi:hypothetical protein